MKIQVVISPLQTQVQILLMTLQKQELILKKLMLCAKIVRGMVLHVAMSIHSIVLFSLDSLM